MRGLAGWVAGVPPEWGVALLALQVKVVLVLVATCAFQRLAGVRLPVERHRIWAVGIAAVVVLPLPGLLVPAAGIEVPVPLGLVQVIGASPGDVGVDGPGPGLGVPGVAEADMVGQGPRIGEGFGQSGPGGWRDPAVLDSDALGGDRRLPVLELLLVFWVAGAAVRLLWIAIGVSRTRALYSGPAVSPHGRVGQAATAAGRAMRLRRRVRVVMSTSVPAPCTAGILRPVVFLPAAADAWPDERLRVALLHEVTHERIGDYLGLLLAELACACHWPNPLVWLARGRLLREQEEACDAEVVDNGVSPADYAMHLVEIARSVHDRTPGLAAALPLAPARRLERRVRRILQLNHGPLPVRRAPAALVLALVAWAVPVALLQPKERRTHEVADTDDPARSREERRLAERHAVSLAPAVETQGQAGLHTPAASESPSPWPDAGDDDFPALAEPRHDSSSYTGASSARRAVTALASADAPFPAAASHIWFEAEQVMVAGAGSGSPNNQLFAGSYVRVRGTAGRRQSESVTFEFDVDHAGRFVLWARLRASTGRRTTLRLSIDDSDFIGWELTGARDGDRRSWFWDRLEIDPSNAKPQPLVLELAAGRHRIQLSADQDIAVDGLLLTADQAYRPRNTPHIPAPAEPVHLWFDAEQATLSWPFVVRGERRDRFVIVDTEDNSRAEPTTGGSAVFRFQLAQAGDYFVWARTQVGRNDGDSFWVRVNNGPWVRWDDLPRERTWQWSEFPGSGNPARGSLVSLGQGENTIELAHREGGVRLDRLLVTNDPGFQPQRSTAAAHRPGAGDRSDARLPSSGPLPS